MSALLNAALGFAAAGNAEGFVDLDAVPEDGASIKVLHPRVMGIYRPRDMQGVWGLKSNLKHWIRLSLRI